MEIKKINLDELVIDDAYADGGSFPTSLGTYNGKWYQSDARDKDGNRYRVIWTKVDWDTEDESNACNWDSPDYVLDEYGYECETEDDFMSMIEDWKADNAEEMDDLEVTEIVIEDGKWVGYAKDEKETYTLTDDGTGNIVINYSGTR